MKMDNFSEQLVVKTRTASDTAKALGIIAAMAVVAAACVFFVIQQGLTILLVVAVGVVIGGVWLLRGIGVEYEYIVTNKELDIDKIVGKRKRTRMITVDLSQAIDFYGYSEKDGEYDTTVYATNGLETDAYCLIVQHSDYGKVNIIFNPNECTKEAISREFPNTLRVRVKKDVK